MKNRRNRTNSQKRTSQKRTFLNGTFGKRFPLATFERLEQRALLTTNPPTPWVQYTLEAEDLQGNSLGADPTITAGTDFKLAAFVQDIRNPADPIPGVFSAFLNVSYDTSLFSITASSHTANQPDPGITFASDFNLTPIGDLSTPGEITGAGAARSSFTAPTTPDRQLVWTIVVHANASGTATFTPSSYVDLSTNDYETALYDPDNPNNVGPGEPLLTPDDLSFVPMNMTVTPSATTPEVSIGDVSLPEGNGPVNTNFVFTASLSIASTQAVMVNYATTPGTAIDGTDYVGVSGTLTFQPGTTTQTIIVPVKGDTLNEPDETFSLALSSPQNATLAAHSTAIGTILNDDPQPSVSVSSPAPVAEGNSGTSPVVFTVALSAASGQAITVAYATADDTATAANNDYVATSGTLTFVPGDTQKLVTVLINGDTTAEANEDFHLILSSPTNATLGTSSGTATILNDDGPHFSIDAPNPTNEGNSGQTPFIFTVSIGTPDPEHTLTVAYNTIDGTATTADNDYLATSGTLTFAPNATSQTITVLVNGDTNLENDETFVVQLHDASSGATIFRSQATATILNDDQAPVAAFTTSTSQVPEGNTGTTPMLLTVTLSGSSTVPALVAYATADGTATTADNDYAPTSGTLTFAAGATSAVITVLINGDTKNEPDETFQVNLSAVDSSATVGTPSSLTATIQNDDPVPTLSLTPVTLPEGNSGTTNFLFTASLSAASGQTITVSYQTSNVSAIAGSDYTATSGTLTFAPGETQKIITVAVIGDTQYEPNETFTVNLSNPTNVSLNSTAAIGTISNDDPVPTLVVSNVTQSEGNSGTTAFVFSVSLSNASSAPMTVTYSTADGTATTADNDYVAANGTLTFAAGQTAAQLVTVLVNGDTKAESNETFTLNVTSSDTNIQAAHGTGTISNDDIPPMLSIGNVSHNEGDSGTTPFVFTVTLSAVSGQTVIVSYNTADGTATLANNDYQATSGTLTFAPGTTAATITVLVNGDTFAEPNETFSVNLLNPAVNASIGIPTGTGTIISESTDTTAQTSPSSLTGKAFIDVNKNSAFDGGEKILAGVGVTLSGTSTANAAVSMQTVTDANGAYSFTSLDPGTYQVSFTTPSGYNAGNTSIGSQGGQTSGTTYTVTISTPGGVNGTDNNFFTSGLAAGQASQRLFLASAQGTGSSGSHTTNVSVTSTPSTINSANQHSVTISGTGEAGASISLVAKNGRNRQAPSRRLLPPAAPGAPRSTSAALPTAR